VIPSLDEETADLRRRARTGCFLVERRAGNIPALKGWITSTIQTLHTNAQHVISGRQRCRHP